MAHLNIEKISLASRDRDKEEQKKNFRKKSLFILINHYLEENGYVNSSEVLKSESKFAMDAYSVCDNINLESILQDFESYYFLRYQKLPLIVKKISENPKLTIKSERTKGMILKNLPRHIPSARGDTGLTTVEHMECLSDRIRQKYEDNFMIESDSGNLKHLELFKNHSAEWQSLANVIMQDVSFPTKVVHWSDIIGHERAKQVLQEAIITSLKYKELFASVLSPWKSFLLYGPSGTGKTSLASAVAFESKATFFNVCISTLVSKWRGESEKLIRVLFDLAKHYTPSVIFIDEIDSLMSHRGCDHEASRRLKTELFCQIDSLLSSNETVFLLGATNIPWELDFAILRRMEKRILINLPSKESRILLFEKFLPPTLTISDDIKLKLDLNYEELAGISENYSASDIEVACKEAKMILMRQVLNKLESFSSDKKYSKPFNIDPLKMSDVLLALNRTKPSSLDFSEKFIDWRNNYGSE